MKFNLILPSKTNFIDQGLSSNGEKHIWQDCAIPIVKIISAVDRPFNGVQSVFVALEKGQTKDSRDQKGQKYFKRLLLKVGQYDHKLEQAILTREVVKAQFAYHNDPLICFAAFRADIKNYWVFYKLKYCDRAQVRFYNKQELEDGLIKVECEMIGNTKNIYD